MQGSTAKIVTAVLGDFAEVLPGLSSGGRLEHTPDGTHQVILSRHLTPGAPYRFSEADAFRIKPGRDASRYEVRSGDVLFMSRGTRNVASWIESVPERTVVPVSFYIIRPTDAMNAGYLTWFLNQPTAQRTISDIRTGAGTPIVQRNALLQMHVPIPDRQTQATIGAMGVAMAREHQTLERLAVATARLHELTSERIARDLIAHAEAPDGD